MRISVCAVGRLKRAPEAELCDDYLARTLKLGRQVGITAADIIEVAEAQRPKPMPAKRKKPRL